MKPHIAQKAPYAVEVTAGQPYYWCSCGLSKNQPFSMAVINTPHLRQCRLLRKIQRLFICAAVNIVPRVLFVMVVITSFKCVV